MSLLIELIKAIATAVEDSRQPGAQRREASGGQTFADLQRRLEQQRQEAIVEAEQTAVVRQAVATKAKTADEVRSAARVQARAEQARADAAPRVHVPTRPERLAAMLRQPRSMRELFVLKELMDKPLALRRGRR
ncbi:MAG: hypothetical protein H0W72_07260 [Planctomycetes bacterium]|nr:hypothetical protein [Planctomycetota bacterium]